MPNPFIIAIDEGTTNAKAITVREVQDEAAAKSPEPQATGELIGIEKPVPVDNAAVGMKNV